MPAHAAEKPASSPDFRHVDAWIFDLDNTLYRADSDLFALIDARMSAYVARLLNVDSYAVLNHSEEDRLVELSLPLLRQQFLGE